MKITEYVGTRKKSDLASAETVEDLSPCSRDSCFFASLLDPSTTIKAVHSNPVLPPAAAEAINPLHTSRTRMAKLLKSTSKEIDIAQFRAFPGLLANIQVTSQLLVKCLAKTTQGIDKISNLQ